MTRVRAGRSPSPTRTRRRRPPSATRPTSRPSGPVLRDLDRAVALAGVHARDLDGGDPRVEGAGDALGVGLRQLGALAREELVDGHAPQEQPALEVAGAQLHLLV